MSDLRRRLFNEFAGEYTNPFEKAPEIINLSSTGFTFLETPTCINGTYFALDYSAYICKSNDLYNWVNTNTRITDVYGVYDGTIGWSAFDNKIWFKKLHNYGLSCIEYNEGTDTFSNVVDYNWASDVAFNFYLLDDIHFTDNGELYCLGKYNYWKTSTTYTWNNEYNYIIASTNNMTSIIPASQQGFNDRYQSGRPDRKALISPHLLAIGDDRVTAIWGQCMIDGDTANSFGWFTYNSSVMHDNTNIVKSAYVYNDLKLNMQSVNATWYHDDTLYVFGTFIKSSASVYGGDLYVPQIWKSTDFGDTYTYIRDLPSNLYYMGAWNIYTYFYNKGVFAWIGAKASGNLRSYYLYSTNDFDSFSSFNTCKLSQNSTHKRYKLIKETEDSYIMYNLTDKLLYRWYK